MKIQHTNISKREDDLYIVDMLIADDPQPDEGQEKIHIVCRVSPTEKRVALPILEIAALDYAKEVLEQQSLGLTRA